MSINGSGRARGRWGYRLALSLTTILATGFSVPAMAQSSPHPNLDANGVDLTTGKFTPTIPIASIGSGQAQLTLATYDGQRDNWSNVYLNQTTSGATTSYQVVLGNSWDNFTSASSASTRGTGATLTDDGNGGMIYRTLDGVEISFTNPAGTPGGTSNLCDANNNNNCFLLPASVAGKSGMAVLYDWTITSACTGINGDNCTYDWRLNTIDNGVGYSLTWAYASDNPSTGPTYHRVASVALKKGSTTVGTASFGNPSSNVYTVTQPGGGVWRFTGPGNALTGIRRPSASSDTTSVSYSSGQVSSVTSNGITTGYSRSVSGSTATMVVTDAQSHTTAVVSDMNKYRPTSVTDGLSRTTNYTYDSVGRITEISAPEGNKIQYTYDSRGNVTETRLKAKSGSGLSDIVTSASYPSSCTTPHCNDPDSTTDALGNVTDYSYDGTTGLLTSVTSPAATSGAKRAQTRYSYTTNGVGVSLLTGVSQCRTGATSDTPSCVGTADEMKTTVAYDSNLNVTSVTKVAGDNSLSATTALTYNDAGDLLTVDGPLSGSSDTTTFRYDADRRRVGTISADPDGGGSLKRRAVKQAYNADGQPTVTELGTVNGTSDSDWSAFAGLQQSTATYDSNGFKTKDVVTASSTTYQVTQYSYDTVGRPECTALRMNSAIWASLPSSACSLGTAGSFGNDRITKATYDAAGHATKVQTGYGVSGVQADEVTTTYSNNGEVATVTDAEGNKTTYSYDGFDRLSKTAYPSTTKGAGTSSSSDYEEQVYNAASDVTSLRLRGYASDSSKHIDYSYDNLGRMTAKDLPSSEPDVTYSYDLTGAMTGASQTGNALTLGYDALGRNTSQGGPLGTMSYQYDAAGRRTRLTWPDSFYVTYDYQVTGEMTAVRENGATSGAGVLATFAYDDLGRRTGVTRGNGTTTSYTYDNISRLASLGQDLASTGNDVTSSFTYSPASEIASRAQNNDAYAWSGHFNVNRGYTANGLNQMTAAGGTSLSFDARGNLTGSGSDSFGYSSENLMTGATVGSTASTLAYDPALRLYEVSSTTSGTTTARRFLYDGTEMLAEYDPANGNMSRRFIFGPGVDEPIVQYLGSGTGTRIWSHADERGSIVARTTGAGTLSGSIAAYDEYGIPNSNSSASRFQYTGQAWLPELGMNYYKARMYSPTLGRFMQTDPIGYGDGLNIYAYVKNDPINKADPSGLGDICVTIKDYTYSEDKEGGVLTLSSHIECYGTGSGGKFEPLLPGSDGSAWSDCVYIFADPCGPRPDPLMSIKPKPKAQPKRSPPPPVIKCIRGQLVRSFPVPKGYHSFYDDSGRAIIKNGDSTNTVISNPSYEAFIGNGRVDWTGFTWDMASIAVGSAGGSVVSQVANTTAGAVGAAGAGIATGSELHKMQAPCR